MKPGIVFCLSGALLWASSVAVPAQSKKRPAKPGSVSTPATNSPANASDVNSGVNAERLARIPERMKAFVERGQTAGIVTLLAQRGKILQLSAVGFQELDGKTPMKEDSIFQTNSKYLLQADF